MKAGELGELIEILTLEQNGDDFAWAVKNTVWAKAEQLGRNNIFSLGLAAKSFKFTIRHCGITLHDAIRREGRHFFLTDINADGRDFLEITSAPVTPFMCSVTRTLPPEVGELNRPVYLPDNTITFPACLTEKYVRHIQLEPMSLTEMRYVLVAPKPVILKPEELVLIGEFSYVVLIPHMLDEFKNEYEIIRVEDN